MRSLPPQLMACCDVGEDGMMPNVVLAWSLGALGSAESLQWFVIGVVGDYRPVMAMAVMVQVCWQILEEDERRCDLW